MIDKKKEEWEQEVIMGLIEQGYEKYEARFFSEMLIKVLWSFQDE